MPVFEYTALNSSGKKLKGIIDADSSGAARQKIRASGNYPVDIKETVISSKKEQGNTLSTVSLFNKVGPQDIHVAARQLSTLLGAGIPLVQSLSSLIDQTANPSLKMIFAQIKDAVNEGNSLSNALSDHPRIFSKIFINMVKAGEASGSLDIVLERLAEFGESQETIKARLKAAMVYPILMAIVGTCVVILLVTFIVPNIAKVFEDTKQALPLPTTLLINCSDFLKNYWWIVFLMIIAFIFLIKYFLTKPKGRHLWDKLKLTLPLLGPLNTRIAAARFGRTLASLLSSGVPLITSLHIVKNILNNVLLVDVLDNASEELEKGRSFSHILKQSPWFSPMLVQMIAVGEQSGTLENMLEKVADNYEREVEFKIMAMTSLIEPLMILAMGLVVSFIIISVLLPILDMNQLIR